MSADNKPAFEAESGSIRKPLLLRVALDVPVDRLFDYWAPEGVCVTPGQMVEAPFGNSRRWGVVIEVAEHTEGVDLNSDRIKPVGRILPSSPLSEKWLELAKFMASYYHYPLGVIAGLAVPLKVRKGTSFAKEETWFAPSHQAKAALATLKPRSVQKKILAHVIAAVEPTPLTALRRLSPSAPLAIAALTDKGHLVSVPSTKSRIRLTEGPKLLPDQASAAEGIVATLGRFQTHLLHGVTGSGKTEVYLRVAEAALARDTQILILLPEIALVLQLENILRQRFPQARVASLHSLVTLQKRSEMFWSAMDGSAQIVLGTRLASLVPLKRLGLVVVDEEHDAAYKQQESLRYQARDIAIYRGQQDKAPVVLCSATPSLESWWNAQLGKYCLWRLSQRVNAAPLPAMHCVNVRDEKLQDGLSQIVKDALAERLSRRELSLVFINRRGYAPALTCLACAWVSPCPHCSATLVVHLSERQLHCHHCGLTTPIPAHCPECGNQDLQPLGQGTQRVEKTLTELFPEARLLRVDRDALKSHRSWESIASTIRRDEADILVGTQILTKGHDFPRLTLVCVINVDASLYSADFRAQERLFAQLIQVSGRGGRGTLSGQTFIQTRYADHPIFSALHTQDYDAFARFLLEQRRQVGFPPFSYQALVIAESNEFQKTLGFLQAARTEAVAMAPSSINIYDAVPMRMQRRADRERGQLLLECKSRQILHKFLTAWIARLRTFSVPNGLRWTLDVDPAEI